jgi:Ser/Thr protein kinase RdoA (MazF antagonist)
MRPRQDLVLENVLLRHQLAVFRLSGLVDFEASHLNYRVADFALSWRGDQDEVLAGYTDVHPLNELDWELLVPVFWSWLFMGIQRNIADILAARREAHGFDWQIKHLLRRSDAVKGRGADLPRVD